MHNTGFFWDEKCFWHSGGNYALTAPVGGLVQPLASGGLPENPETKRRLKNLMDVTGLAGDLDCLTAASATYGDLNRIHPASYLENFKSLSDGGGGEMGLRTPFGAGGYEIAALSTGLVKGALLSVLNGRHDNAYALSRPPGHHCLPDWSNGFCLLANIAIAIEAAKSEGLAQRVAVVDWDVHHGNGTEAIFYERDDVLTISLHQERNYPTDTGEVADRGKGAGVGHNVNIPLPPGAGHAAYIHAMNRIVLPALVAYKPDVIIVACGFDASGVDPLSRMLCSAETYRLMTRQLMQSADKLCDGKLVMAHEGGYSEVHVPFCGHAVLQEMSGSEIDAGDAMGARIASQQPNAVMENVFADLIESIATDLEL
ncbi:class II histone deacetylase [Rhodobacterales bacterium 52_120_T64]|nr:class II histone deacetylase [Rhodobacterales bacterium 52_120_T64]